MKKAEFLLEVQAELDNIKTNATKEELGKLRIDSFSVNSPTRCIYGLMTGSCISDRAKELSPKVYSNVGGDLFSEQDFTKEEIGYFTALEKYLYMVKPSMHAKIIDYLKDKTQVIKLT